jgi:K+-sensing histidine kinase KdpD
VPRSSATCAGTRWTSIEPAGKAGALGQPFPGTPVDAGAAAAPTEIPQGRGESGSSQASDRAALPASAIRAPDAAAPKREPAAVNLHDLIRSCVTQCQPKANLAYLLIRTSLFPIPLSVRVDTEMLRALIVNLLDYAIKSTRSGGQIIVSCACPLDAHGEPASIVLRVRGSGGCLRDQELSAALNASAKSASRPNSAASALVLAKVVAEAIGASFAVTSGANDSTLVTIAFPRTAAANDPEPA